MKKSLIILAFITAVAIAAIFVFTQTATTPSPASSGTNLNNQPSNDESALAPDTSSQEAARTVVTLNVTNDGFTLSKVTAKVGDTINVRNNSDHSVQFSSDPHPIHTKNNELNQLTIKAGTSQTFKVTRAGTWGFHDHLNANLTGVITVE